MENRFRKLFEEKREKMISKEFTKEALRKALQENTNHKCYTSQSTFNRIINDDGIPSNINPDILLAFAEYFNVTTDYLLCLTDIPYKNENMPKLEQLGLSSDAIDYLKKSTEYERLVLDASLKNGYFYDICYAIYSYMQTYYKEITVNDGDVESEKLKDTEKMEFAEYRAAKHFSSTLINKISKDKDIIDYSRFEHTKEYLDYFIKSGKYKELSKEISQVEEEWRNEVKNGTKVSFKDFLEAKGYDY